MTHEEFIKSLVSKNKNIEFLTEYKGSNAPIECRCTLCNRTFTRQGRRMYDNCTCPFCQSNKSFGVSLNTRKSNFIKKLNKKHPNIQLIGEYIDCETKTQFKCSDCGFIFEKTPTNVLVMKSECPNCAKAERLKIKNLNFNKEFKKYSDRLEVLSDTSKVVKMKSKFTVRCKKCGYEWETSLKQLKQLKHFCPVCTGKVVLVGYNDMWITNPELAKLLNNPNDGYKYMQNSNKSVDFKCPDCGSIIHKKILDVRCYGLRCQICNDHFSYGEKIFRNLFILNNINFQMHKRFNWSNNKEYDFYLPDYNYIFEINGLQHYKEACFTIRTLSEEQENDAEKMKMALKNNIDKYIVIDFRESTTVSEEVFKIVSSTCDLLDIKIDINICSQLIYDAQKSIVIQAIDLYNEGNDVKDITNKLSIGLTTVRNYIRTGDKLGLCTYKRKKTGNAKKVYYDSENIIFESIADASRYFNTNDKRINKMCDIGDIIHF